MIAIQKAQELFEKYVNVEDTEWTIDNGCGMSTNEIKQCALICVDEILQAIEDIDDGQTFIPYDYWEEVKKEIELL
jgi:hypothetical protein